MAAFFITTSYGNRSIADYFSGLAGELVKRGHRVTMLAAGCRRDLEDVTGNPALLTWPSPRPTGWRDAWFLRRLIAERRPACIIGNFAAVNLSLLVGWACGVPCRIAWYHTLRHQVLTDHEYPAWRLRALTWRKMLVYRFATHIIANSAAAAADVQRHYRAPEDRIAVLPYLVPDPAIPVAVREPRKIVSVGRLDPSKGQATLIRALPLIRAACAEASLEIVGDGPERRNYEALAVQLGVGAHCRFTGTLPLPTVLERMASAAVCVSPSLSEAFGLVNVEAQSVGTPVVASAVGGIADVIVDGETGYLVPPGNAPAFAEKIIQLLTNPALQKKFGQRARLNFETRFSSRNFAQQADCLERLVAARQSTGLR